MRKINSFIRKMESLDDGIKDFIVTSRPTKFF